MFECNERNVYLFAVVGIIFITLFFIYMLNIVKEGIKLFILPRYFPTDVKKYGEWAVITGSTNGIGKSYARELARRKMNIVLVSRNLEKLRNTSEELKQEFNVNVDIIQADFTKGWELQELLKEELKKKNIGILINNVGILAPQPCYFLSISDKEILDIIHVNITSVLLMTRIVLPAMLKKKCGAIVTISSIMHMLIGPLVSCYGATKATVYSIATAISQEKLPNVEFQTLFPSCITTGLFDHSHRFWKWVAPFVPNADSFVSSAINTLGKSKHTTGYLGHSVLIPFKVIPEIVQKYAFYFICLSLYEKQISCKKLKKTVQN